MVRRKHRGMTTMSIITKILGLLLLSVLLLTAGCGDEEEPYQPTQEEETTP